MLGRPLIAVLALAIGTGSAHSQWITHVNEDPFRGNETIAMVADGISALGFSCTKPSDLMMLYVVPERHDPSHGALLKMPVVIKVIVDDRPVVDVSGRVTVVPNGNWYRFVSDDDEVADIAKSVASAKRRVAAAVTFLGQLGHSKQFTVGGSGRALGKLLANCKLPTS